MTKPVIHYDPTQTSFFVFCLKKDCLLQISTKISIGARIMDSKERPLRLAEGGVMGGMWVTAKNVSVACFLKWY